MKITLKERVRVGDASKGSTRYIPAGETVDLPKAVAEDLLDRGRAVKPAAAPRVIDAGEDDSGGSAGGGAGAGPGSQGGSAGGGAGAGPGSQGGGA